MRIAQDLVDELVDHALGESPLECCGMVGGYSGEAREIYRCVNAAASEVRYEVDGDDQFHTQLRIEREGLELVAIYHSHTHAEPYPSLMDIETALHPEALYVIVGVQDPDWPEVRAFWIRDGKVTEEQLQR